MNRYEVWTPMTDTTELARIYRGAPVTDLPTSEIWLLDLPPAVTRVARPSHWETLSRYGWLVGLLLAGLLCVLLVHVQAIAPTVVIR